MNILFLVNHLNTGGITSYVLRLGSALKARGHNIYIASSGGERAGQFIAAGFTYLPIPMSTKCELNPKIIFSLFKLLPLVRAQDIEIIHCNSRTTQVLGHFLSKYSRIPYLSTCHGFFKKRLSRLLFPCWGRRIIAISEQVKGHLIEDFKVKEELIRVIPHGIETERFRLCAADDARRAKNKFGLKEAPVVGHIGRLSDVKGQEYLLRAMKRVLEKEPRAQLLIVGEGRMKKTLVGLAKALNIFGSVSFLAQAQDTAEALSAMDIFVLPSLEEGLGLALMEAMAAGKAVVASDVGGIKTLIRERVNGLLAPPKDADGLAAAILRLMADPQEAKRLGKNAREFIEKDFALERMASETEKTYLECLSLKKQ